MAGGRRPRAGTPLHHKHRGENAARCVSGEFPAQPTETQARRHALADSAALVGRQLTLATLGLGSRHEASEGPIHPQTTRSPVFHSATRGQVRILLGDVDRLELGPPQGGLLATRNVGGLLEMSVGSAEYFFELDSRDGAARMWPLLQQQVAAAHSASTGQESSPGLFPASGGSVADELAKLAQLKNDGVLSAAEFEQLKERVLADDRTAVSMARQSALAPVSPPTAADPVQRTSSGPVRQDSRACPACGTSNRADRRSCWSCSARLD
jgi:Short C-terminal domain